MLNRPSRSPPTSRQSGQPDEQGGLRLHGDLSPYDNVARLSLDPGHHRVVRTAHAVCFDRPSGSRGSAPRDRRQPASCSRPTSTAAGGRTERFDKVGRPPRLLPPVARAARRPRGLTAPVSPVVAPTPRPALRRLPPHGGAVAARRCHGSDPRRSRDPAARERDVAVGTAAWPGCSCPAPSWASALRWSRSTPRSAAPSPIHRRRRSCIPGEEHEGTSCASRRPAGDPGGDRRHLDPAQDVPCTTTRCCRRCRATPCVHRHRLRIRERGDNWFIEAVIAVLGALQEQCGALPGAARSVPRMVDAQLSRMPARGRAGAPAAA